MRYTIVQEDKKDIHRFKTDDATGVVEVVDILNDVWYNIILNGKTIRNIHHREFVTKYYKTDAPQTDWDRCLKAANEMYLSLTEDLEESNRSS